MISLLITKLNTHTWSFENFNETAMRSKRWKWVPRRTRALRKGGWNRVNVAYFSVVDCVVIESCQLCVRGTCAWECRGQSTYTLHCKWSVYTEMVHDRARAPPRQTWRVAVNEGRWGWAPDWRTPSFVFHETAFSKRDVITYSWPHTLVNHTLFHFYF